MFIPASLCSAWVVGMVRIKWSTSIGLDGRHRSEQVVDIIGIRIDELTSAIRTRWIASWGFRKTIEDSDARHYPRNSNGVSAVRKMHIRVAIAV